jgi:16S rRNA (cytidine1402-2'-O)-methyltransferase
VKDDTKRQNLPSGLWVVATPLGNLEDITIRAQKALSSADAILCEDTRRTAKLTAALGISKRLERLDAHASPQRVDEVVKRLLGGESLALVTDAGTPGISDPGSALVKKALEAGVRVVPVPGPSAVTALLSVSGFSDSSFVFSGFFPRKNGEREESIRLLLVAKDGRAFVWFESPERIVGTLEMIGKMAPECRVIAAKELTKIHEKLFFGSAADVASQVQTEIESEGALGEWVFAVSCESRQKTNEKHAESDESSDWVKALRCLLDAQVSAPEAARRVSHNFGVSKRIVYERALKIFGKK